MTCVSRPMQFPEVAFLRSITSASTVPWIPRAVAIWLLPVPVPVPVPGPGLQAPEGFGHLEEGRAIAQGAGLALDDCPVMPPVIDRLAQVIVGTLDDPRVFAQDLSLGGDDDPLRVDPQADRPVPLTLPFPT